MDHREELRREMLGTFHAELDEHLATASRVLLALEEKPGADETKQLVIEVLRVAHSLKGVARVVDVSDIERIFHAMEDILTLVRDRGILLQRPHYDAFFATLDMARSVMDAHMAGQVFSPSGVQKLVDQLKGLPVTSEEQASPEPEVQLPKPPPATTPTSGSPDVGETAADFSADDQPAPESATDEALPRPRAIVADETIRMSTGKLDALMASVGQLLVSRMRIEQRLTELREFQSGIAKRDKEWRKVKRTITRSRRSSSNRSAQAVPMSLQEANPISEFLVSNEQHMEEALDDLSQLVRSFDADYAYLTLLTDDLQDVVRRIRMLPIASLFDRFPRMVRDLSQGLGKEIGLVVEGEDTEVDRQVMELIADPLTHLLRNAVSHGIEGKDERLKSNKPERGEIVLRALQRGNNIVVEVEDDGGGIRLDEVKRKAVQRGLLSATDASHLSERGTLELIFHSGLTTVSEVSDISGRGVGLDVVRENLEKLGGQISVTTSAANGTTFTLTLPLTMTTSHVLLVEVAGQTVAVPTTTVLRILRVAPSEIGTLEGHHVIRLDDRPIPLLSLNEVLELGEGRLTFSEYEKVQIVVLAVADRTVAFYVDRFVGTQVLVVKRIGRQLRRIRNVAGASILGNGDVVMILNVGDLMKSAELGGAFITQRNVEVQDTSSHRVLVVDDSITTRTLEKNILTNAGYEVVVASDGAEAWSILQADHVDAVVSDVDMPNMNGFQLAEYVRADDNLKHLPFVLVTGKERREDRLRGLQAGANVYMTKGSFDQNELLETLEQLLG